MSCPQTHNCLLTGYGAPRAPSASQDPIPGLLWDWVQIFETPTQGFSVVGFPQKYFFHCVILDQTWAKHPKISSYPRFYSGSSCEYPRALLGLVP